MTIYLFFCVLGRSIALQFTPIQADSPNRQGPAKTTPKHADRTWSLALEPADHQVQTHFNSEGHGLSEASTSHKYFRDPSELDAIDRIVSTFSRLGSS